MCFWFKKSWPKRDVLCLEQCKKRGRTRAYVICKNIYLMNMLILNFMIGYCKNDIFALWNVLYCTFSFCICVKKIKT